MRNINEEVILTAIASLKGGCDKKVKVTELAAKLGITRKTLHSNKYKHLLEYCASGIEIDDNNSFFIRELAQAKKELLDCNKEVKVLRDSFDDERNKVIASTFSELLLNNDSVTLNIEQLTHELNGLREQLNTKITTNKKMEFEIASLNNKCQTLEALADSAYEKNNATLKHFYPDLDKAADVYEETKSYGQWLKEYISACKAMAKLIVKENKYKKVVLYVSTFNSSSEEICRHVNYDIGKHAVLNIVIPTPLLRKKIINVFKKVDIELSCIYSQSALPISKWYVRTEKLRVPVDVVKKLHEQVIQPTITEGFCDVYMRVIK